nr:hypothetical protein [Tanacetum cinerariifolium]
MANLSKDIQCASSDTRPPMLDREPLTEGTEGALHLGLEQPRVYFDLTPEEKERYNTDIRATNIILQGLSKDIYSIINHYTDAKDIWDNVKMLLEGSKLTKEDRESQLMQLNSKFVNNMLPELDRFVTAVKLNRGLRDSNYDQLYAYLKQHEAHANENKMMLDRFTQHTVDPLALIQHIGETIHDFYVPFTKLINDMRNIKMPMPQMQLNSKFVNNMLPEWGLSPIDNLIENLTNTLALLTQSYKTYLLQTNNQLRTSSNTRNQATIQVGRVVVQNVQGGQDNAVDEDVDELPVQDLALNVDNVFQAGECDAFDSDVDEVPTAQTMFMANLSSADPVYDEAGPSYDLDILSEVQNHDNYQDAVCEHHEVHEMHDNVQPNCIVYLNAEYTGDSNMILYDHTPVKLVPRVLPTKSQVKINIFARIQLFLEFDKTYKKRITPTGLTEGEKGFEQTKTCYLIEVILFFKTIKEHFEGIQKALINEIKEIKEVFDQMDADVDQNVVDKKCDEIERKNLLIENENLIAECLSKEVFYIATNSELTVCRFSEMHDAHTVAQACCLELEAELSKLKDKIKKDDHNEMVKHFSNLKVNHLNLQLKYQHLKESFGNNKSLPARDALDFDSFFKIRKMKASIQGKDNAIKKLRMQISQLKETRSEADRTLDFKTLDIQIT